MTKKDDLAFPVAKETLRDGGCSVSGGLTKREWFAGMIFSNLAVRLGVGEGLARDAVEYADALIAELDKEK